MVDPFVQGSVADALVADGRDSDGRDSDGTVLNGVASAAMSQRRQHFGERDVQLAPLRVSGGTTATAPVGDLGRA